MSIEYKIIQSYGVVADHGEKGQLRLNLMSWAGHEEVYDLRAWVNEEPMRGMTFKKDELLKIMELVNQNFGNINVVTQKPRQSSEVDVQALLREALAKKSAKSKNKTPTSTVTEDVKKSVEKQITSGTRGRRAKAATAATTEKKIVTKVIEFPKAKPEVEVMITDGSATYDECVAKLNAEREKFKDHDSQYVIDGLLELCKVDQNFRNNVMLPSKSYEKSFEYFAEMAKKGYAMKYGNNIVYLDNDLALAYAIDYFNTKE